MWHLHPSGGRDRRAARTRPRHGRIGGTAGRGARAVAAQRLDAAARHVRHAADLAARPAAGELSVRQHRAQPANAGRHGVGQSVRPGRGHRPAPGVDETAQRLPCPVRHAPPRHRRHPRTNRRAGPPADRHHHQTQRGPVGRRNRRPGRPLVRCRGGLHQGRRGLRQPGARTAGRPRQSRDAPRARPPGQDRQAGDGGLQHHRRDRRHAPPCGPDRRRRRKLRDGQPELVRLFGRTDPAPPQPAGAARAPQWLRRAVAPPAAGLFVQRLADAVAPGGCGPHARAWPAGQVLADRRGGDRVGPRHPGPAVRRPGRPRSARVFQRPVGRHRARHVGQHPVQRPAVHVWRRHPGPSGRPRCRLATPAAGPACSRRGTPCSMAKPWPSARHAPPSCAAPSTSSARSPEP